MEDAFDDALQLGIDLFASVCQWISIRVILVRGSRLDVAVDRFGWKAYTSAYGSTRTRRKLCNVEYI